jgi:16S rRNA A1518/A1519 N6-dimethyltransferase RsmA/KsgA/DIM1 with predicted DNA glycosylase/AP lyase activity
MFNGKIRKSFSFDHLSKVILDPFLQKFEMLFADKIAGEADVFDCFVCEVGSGPGSLTRSVLHAGARHVAAVEIDRRFIPALEVT